MSPVAQINSPDKPRIVKPNASCPIWHLNTRQCSPVSRTVRSPPNWSLDAGARSRPRAEPPHPMTAAARRGKELGKPVTIGSAAGNPCRIIREIGEIA